MLIGKNVRKLYFVIVAVLILLVGLLGATSCISMPVRKFEDTRSMMDTFVTITVYSNDEKKAEEAIDVAYERIEQIEKEASIFDEDSESFILNRYGTLDLSLLTLM